MQPQHLPNLDQSQNFLECLDCNATTWTFQTFDDNAERKDKSLARIFNGTLDEHAAELTRLQQRGAGVFVTVNETDGKGRKRENIAKVRAFFLDLDGAPLEPVTTWG
jgi:putative DNA primase/helicase